MPQNTHRSHRRSSSDVPALLFDLDGTLVDSVYEHVLAWTEALQDEGIHYPSWNIHRRVGMGGEIFLKALLREVGASVSESKVKRLEESKARARYFLSCGEAFGRGSERLHHRRG